MKIFGVLTMAVAAWAGAADVRGEDWLAHLGDRVLGAEAGMTSYRSVYGRVVAKDKACDEAWTQLKTQDEVLARGKKMRAEMAAALGGFPTNRCPLNAQIVATVKREGYRIEKVMFESWPGVHVTANLFLPDTPKFKAPYPAILVPCGHTRNGKGAVAYQRGCVLAAKAGMAALIYDPFYQGERYQDDVLKNPCHGHNRIGTLANLLGQNTARYRIWDGMRALDYLESRKDVKGPFGCMGQSGGGTMTSLLMAIEPRIAVACPAGYLTNCRESYESVGPGDAEQNVFGQFAFGLNHASYILMKAPMPVRVECNHQDYFPYSGTMKTMDVVRELVGRVGLAGRYDVTSADGHHGWNEALRVSSVEWCERWLKNEPAALRHDLAGYQQLAKGFVDAEHDCGLTDGAECVTEKGRVLDLPGERTVFDVLRGELEALLAARKGPPTPEAVCRVARITQPGTQKVTRVEKRRQALEGDLALVHEAYEWPEANHAVPAVTFVPKTPALAPVIIVGDGNRAARRRAVERALAEGRVVVAADLLGTGEIDGRRHVFYARPEKEEGLAVLLYTLGKTLAGEQASELLELAADVKRRYGTAPQIVAYGRTAIAAAHAYAARRDLVSDVEVVEAPPPWTTSVREAYIIPFSTTVYGALKAYDWVDLLPKPADRLAKRVRTHAMTEAVSLAGTWEMAYRPTPWRSGACPVFKGVAITNAVPGFWEDQKKAFRAAGMTDDFRINPLHVVQTYPITDYACDMTRPNLYGAFFYRRSFTLDRTGPAVLAFDCVRNEVGAWINGRFIAFRQGFSTPFELAVPEGVLRKGTNEIVLAVANTPNFGYCDADVSGMTTRSLFRATGGIDGRCELRFVKNPISDVYVTTAADLQSFTVHVTGGAAGFDWTIADGGRTLAKGRSKGDFTLSTEGYAWWSPEHPKRYALTLTTPQGVYRQLFGIRRLQAYGEKLRLNGEPIYLRGVTEHCYFPETVHLPRDLETYRRITAKRKELGFNFVRFHTFVPVEAYFEATDELGMLVHVETPNYVSEEEFAAIIAFARRHPSVVIYCTGNETRIDRIAEAYLRHVAEMVHTGTDALFSPMSAMRGIEYALMKGRDDIVKTPFAHNPKRMARVARYSDLFNSYQLGLTSYDSLNSAGPATLDAWGDAYCNKPRLSHEISIDGTYVDFSTEKLYPPDSPILAAGMFQGLRRHLLEKGEYDKADLYFRNSSEWMRRIRKFTFEKVRAADRVAGYDFLGDINTHGHTFGYSVGMMDEFYRLKPGETVENVRRYNSPAVLLTDLGSDFTVEAGAEARIGFSISNYDRDFAESQLAVSLVRVADGTTVWARTFPCGAVPNGRLTALARSAVGVPASATPVKYLLKARFTAARGAAVANEWELFGFPKLAAPTAKNVRVVTDISRNDLLAAMEKGERVLLFGAGPFKSVKTSFRSTLAGRSNGHVATVVKAGHPSLETLPHEGYCGWEFRRLLEGGRSVQLEGPVPFDPIVEMVTPARFPIRRAALFEYRVGNGRLVVCGFNVKGESPAQAWLRNTLIEYAASEACAAETVSVNDLARLLAVPTVTGTKNANLATNPNDPSSSVRAGASAQP